jgi:hypothetical protein
MTHMYYADLEVIYEDGSTGAKRFESVTLASAQKQADNKLKEMIDTSKFVNQWDGDTTFQIKSHKISSGKINV